MYLLSKKALYVILAYVILAVVSAIIVIAMICKAASAAEPHVIVSFNDVEHLAALKDSVIEVCDSVEYTRWQAVRWMDGAFPDSIAIIESGYPAEQIRQSPYDRHIWEIGFRGWVITCRELVTMTVVVHEQLTIIETGEQGFIPGQAIICYRKVER